MKHIPNMITCLNLFAGCMACVMALKFDSYLGAFIFILLAAVFDFLDGFAARLLKAYSSLGAQLDSLADVVSFGAAPGFMVYSYLVNISTDSLLSNSIPFLAFLLPIFAAIRLAKFNIDTRQTHDFLGLPVPACGIFWAAFIPAINEYSYFQANISSIIIIVLIIAFALLMVSEIPMFSLKLKHLKWKGNQWVFSFLAVALVLIVVLAGMGYLLWSVCATILLYILTSMLKNLCSQ